jgi:vancomycin resistance protein YoaR
MTRALPPGQGVMSDLNVPYSPGPPVAAESEAVIPDVARRLSTRGRFAAAFGFGLFAALALGAAALYAYDRHYEGRVLPGVRVGSVDLSGMWPADARAALDTAYAALADGQLTLRTPVGSRSVSYADIGRRLDTEALVAEALGTGRSGNLVDRVVANTRTALRGVTIQPRVVIEAGTLQDEVDTLGAEVHREPVDATIAATKKGFALEYGRDGRELVPEVPRAALEALVDLETPPALEVPLRVVSTAPEVTSLEAYLARLSGSRIARDVVLRVGGESWTIKAGAIRNWITFQATADGGYAPVIDSSRIPRALRPVAREIVRPARDASFLVGRGGGIVGVTAARNGRKLDTPATAARIADTLRARAQGSPARPIRPVLTVITPKLSTEEAERSAPLMKRISKWTTYFPIGIKNGFGANIWIPASLIDGYVVAPGATFDFWKAVGPVTREKGYRDGGAIINGRTEPQGALAGGICSCSTTLFNAALRAGFEMKARRNHYYYIDRYPLGLDATVFISAGGSVQTMSWRNDTRHPVLIRGINSRDGSAGYVTFELYSVPNGRRVVIGNPTVRNVRYATDTIQYTNTLPPGVRERIEYPVNGMQVWRTVSVFEKGKLLRRTTYYSNYARITGITLVGRGAQAA